MKRKIIDLRNQFLSSNNEQKKSVINDELTKLRMHVGIAVSED